MSIILAIDATEQQCSAALSIDGKIKSSVHENQPRKHAELLLPMVDSMLNEAQVSRNECQPPALDAIAVTIGPGAFTGIRIGCSIAQGLAFAWQLPIVPIVSLEALANQWIQASQDQAVYLPLFDARLGEVYAGLYQKPNQLGASEGHLTAIQAPCLMAPEDLNVHLKQAVAAGKPVLAMGSGLVHENEIFDGLSVERIYIPGAAQQQVSAESVAKLAEFKFQQGGFIDPLTLEPNYIRRAVQ